MFEDMTREEREEAIKVVEECRDGKWAELSSDDPPFEEPECELCNIYHLGCNAPSGVTCPLKTFAGGDKCYIEGEPYYKWRRKMVQQNYNSPECIAEAKAMRDQLDRLAKALRAGLGVPIRLGGPWKYGSQKGWSIWRDGKQISEQISYQLNRDDSAVPTFRVVNGWWEYRSGDGRRWKRSLEAYRIGDELHAHSNWHGEAPEGTVIVNPGYSSPKKESVFKVYGLKVEEETKISRNVCECDSPESAKLLAELLNKYKEKGK